MADSMSYSQTNYMPPQYYSSTQHIPNHGHVHAVSPPPRPENTQRKRPKYTRSKTGCLTCRVKKIKCDETKPDCMRCTHGQRDCIWPEGVPARKKSTPRKDSVDRPSTAGSSGPSESSTPPTRDHTPPPPPPPRRAPVELGLPPLASRRSSDPYLQLHPISSDDRRQHGTSADRGSGPGYHHLHHPASNASLSMIPEISSYPTQSRYDQGYAGRVGPTHSSTSGMRLTHHQPISQWNQTILPSVDPIEPYFHTFQERNLIRHYCDNSISFIMAVPSENPVAAANLPLIFSRFPGDSSAEALRMALLGVAAIHQSFLLVRSAATQQGAAAMMQLARSYRMNSKQQLAKACTTLEGTQSDASLAASSALALMDIFSGGRNWLRNMNLAKTLVNVRGGPVALLALSSASGSAEASSRTRLFLETITVYDVFGSLANGQEPSLLTNDWWHDDVNNSYVEQVFGVSRSLVPLLAQITTFVSRTLKQDTTQITEVTENPEDTVSDNTKKCHDLYNLLDNWTNPSNTISVRIRTGDRIYQKASQIMLLRDVLGLSHTDRLVQECASAVLSLCWNCCESKMAVDLIWPVIIAGSNVFQIADRNRVSDILEAFRMQCCYEIDTSGQIVFEVWRRLDQKLPRAEWRSVMADLDLNVLVL